VSRVERLALAAAAPIGVLIGVVDTRAEEVQPAVILHLVAAGCLGALASRVAIPIGVLVGLGVPIVHAYMRLNQLPLPYATDSYLGTFLALIPAMLGAIAGAWARRHALRAECE
jgi:hypothetical protein